MFVYQIVENLDNTYGGPSRSVPFLAHYLKDLGILSEILSVSFHNNESNSLVEKYGLNWSSFPYAFSKVSRFSPSFRNYLSNAVRGKTNILLHSHTQWNYVPYITYKTALRYNTPLVVSVRGALYKNALKKSSIKKIIAMSLFQKKIFENATILHVSEPSEALAVRELGIKTPLAIIQNGVDHSEFEKLCSKNESKARLNLDKSKNYLLFMGSVHPHKGVEIAVNSFLKLYHKFGNWDFIIAGPFRDAAYTRHVQEIVKKAQAKDRIHFLGMIAGEKRIDVFNASSLFISPTVSENFGLSISEAMAAGVPVITTTGTPWRGIVDHNLGWWVNLSQENIDSSLYDALSEDLVKLEDKGRRGKEYIKQFSWQEQASKMKQVYEFALFGIDNHDIVIKD